MNISNIKLNGINYNLTDKETQNLISQVQANTYTKNEVDSAISIVNNKLSNYVSVESFNSTIGNIDSILDNINGEVI